MKRELRRFTCLSLVVALASSNFAIAREAEAVRTVDTTKAEAVRTVDTTKAEARLANADQLGRFYLNMGGSQARDLMVARARAWKQRFQNSPPTRDTLATTKASTPEQPGLVRELGGAFGHGVTHHVGVTALTIVVLAVAEGIRVQNQTNRLQNVPGPSDAAVAWQATKEALGGLNLIAGMAGGTSTASGLYIAQRILAKPLTAITHFLSDTRIGPYFTRLIGTAITSAAIFIGWIAIDQLYQMAVSLLDNEIDLNVAKQLSILKVIRAESDEIDRIVFVKILENMYAIFATNPDLRSSWTSAIFRLGIMNGEFVATYTFMLGAGIAAGTFFGPVGFFGGVAVGTVTGIVAGAAAHYLPHEYKDVITEAAKDIRMQTARVQSETTLRDIEQLLRRFEYGQSVPDPQRLIRDIKTRLQYLKAVRDRALTVAMEKTYDAAFRIGEIERKKQMVEKHHSTDSPVRKEIEAEWEQQMPVLMGVIIASCLNGNAFYEQQLIRIERLKSRQHADGRAVLPPAVYWELDQFFNQSVETLSVFRALSAALSPVLKSLFRVSNPLETDQALRTFTLIRLLGWADKALLNFVRASDVETWSEPEERAQ